MKINFSAMIITFAFIISRSKFHHGNYDVNKFLTH